MCLNHMVPLRAVVRKPFGSEIPLSAATKALTEELIASKRRDMTKSHPMTEGAEVLQTGCWNG